MLKLFGFIVNAFENEFIYILQLSFGKQLVSWKICRERKIFLVEKFTFVAIFLNKHLQIYFAAM